MRGREWWTRGAAALAAVCLAAVVEPAHARQDQAPDACEKYKAIPAPKGDASGSALGASAASCDSGSLYYGFGRAPQPVKARACAYRELGKHDPSRPISGEAILAMIYANAKGVQRNFDLALKFACEMDAAPAEMEGRIAHLEKLKADGWTGSNFDVCDDITSGYMGGFCAEKQERFDKAAREKKLAAITAGWRAQDRQAFASLESAAQKFFSAHSSNEIDLSGSGRAGFEIEENARLEDSFLADIERFERGEWPRSGPGFAAADAQLNSVYSKLMKASGPNMGTITPQGIRETERLWIVYRDAWAKFGPAKYPATHADDWRAWCTVERVGQLKVIPGSN